MSDLQIRRAVTDDAETLARFNEAMAFETEGKRLDAERIRAGVRRVLEDPTRGFYLVAERGTERAGQLMVTYEWSDWRDGFFWWIQSVYVPAAHRRTGVYRALYQRVLDDAQETGGVCGVRLYVEKANAVAKSTYESLGMNPGIYDFYEVEL
jgi:ribosomal protein S18 acetylase RimI-like enzyme